MEVQVFHHLHIVRAGGMAAVQQLHQHIQRAVRFKIAVDQLVPALTVRIGHLGVTIAGQVHEVGGIHTVKVDGCRFARRCADARQIFAVAQPVDQAGFAHVGTAGKDKFRAVAFRQLAGKAIGCLKFTAIIIHKYNSLFRLFRVGHITAAGSLAVLCSVAISWVACGMVRLWAADAAGRMSACLST